MAGAAQTAAPPRTGTGRGIGGVARRLTTETKHALKTTEFYAYAVTFALILIAGAVIKQKDNVDAFRADKVWLYITILTIGYMISRGLAKAGSREPYTEGSGKNGSRDGNDRN